MREVLLNIVDGLYALLAPYPAEVSGDPRYHYWRDTDRLWRYALVAANGEPMSASTQGHMSRAAVLRAIGAERRNSSIALVVEVAKAPQE